jgi:hypothetical protein
MKKLFYYFVVMPLLLVVASCAPLPNPIKDEEKPPVVCKLMGFNEGTRKVVFKYDKNNKITSFDVTTTFVSSPTLSTYNVIYDVNGNVTDINETKGNYTYFFSYSSAKSPRNPSSLLDLSKVRFSNIMQEIYLSYTSETKVDFVLNSVKNTEYFYRLNYDINNNITSCYFTRNNGTTISTLSNTYDNKKNPYKLLPFPIYWVLFRTNPIGDACFLAYFSQNNLLSLNTLSYKYNTYSAANYPLNGISHPNNTLQFFYEDCQ